MVKRNKGKRRFSRQKAGSEILLQIVIFIVVVFSISGFSVLFLFRNSQSRLIEKSKSKLIEFKAEQIASTNNYLVNMLTQIQVLTISGSKPGPGLNWVMGDVSSESTIPAQKVANELLEQLVYNGFFNSKMAFFAKLPEPGTDSGPMIVTSSDPNSLGKEVPSDLAGIIKTKAGNNTGENGRIDGQNTYMLFRDGVQEFGLAGAQLVSAYMFEPAFSESRWLYFNISSMGGELAGIESFYAAERTNIDKRMFWVGLFSLLIIITITFLVLSYLIRVNITRPIEELTDTAQKVMDGDLDVSVPIKKGEDFERLKIAFNKMIMSLKQLVKGSDLDAEKRVVIEFTGSEREWNQGLSEEPVRNRRPSIFIEVTVLVIIVYILSGALGLFLFRQSQGRLIEKSKEKIVKSAAESVISGHHYISNLVERYFSLAMPDLVTSQSLSVQIETIKNKERNEVTDVLNDVLRVYPETGFNDLELAFEAMPPVPGFLDNPIIVVSTDEKLMYADLPGDLKSLHDMSIEENSAYRERIDRDSTYMLAGEGINELGLDGEYLVTTYDHRIEDAGNSTLWFFSFKPMGEQLAVIDDFYDSEMRSVFTFMGIVILLGVSLFSVVTIFLLGHLVKVRVSDPLDELTALAERVTEGDLGTEIIVGRREEFAGLKESFNEMLRSIKESLARGVMK